MSELANELDAPAGSPFRLPALIGRCPDCGGPLDCAIAGGDEHGHMVMLTCAYNCDGPGLQCDWQPIKDAARRYVNSANRLPSGNPNQPKR